MAGVEADKAHAPLHPLHDLMGQCVRHGVLEDVGPPDQHVGTVQEFLREPALRLVQVRHFHLKIRLSPQEVPDGAHQAFRVYRADALRGIAHRGAEIAEILLRDPGADKLPPQHPGFLGVFIPQRHTDHAVLPPCVFSFI